ncbi:YncE family protein [Candidatus Nitrosocosmicus franklandus]|uniref:6-phosphogluconolactonase n=1 Tax=Candidatus Nitrosocosmicus franklandianus TaxID=1798806 RepID=A0A484IH90_9ARCH|nr:YncE family protein [Candidatus Nitrosocosmicus franklandus]VFJ15392.1 6-phosphogluconolactonase [Candidatus Nitrosocosmicus franklandus]
MKIFFGLLCFIVLLTILTSFPVQDLSVFLNYQQLYRPFLDDTISSSRSSSSNINPTWFTIGSAFGQESGRNFVAGFYTGSYPIGVAINPLTDKVYVANQYSNTVSVYDAKTDKLIKTIPAGTFPYGVDANPYNNRIYVTNRGSDDLTVIDGATDSVIDNIAVGKSPVQVTVDQASSWVYVTNIDSNSVSVIDGITNVVKSTINGIDTPYGIGVNPLSNKIYVSNIANSNLTVIDKDNYDFIKNIEVQKAPVGIDINEERNLIYVANYGSDSVSVINGSDDKVISTLPVGKSPVGLKENPILDKLYVSNIDSNTVSVINESNFEKAKEIKVNPSSIIEREVYPYAIPTNIKFPLIASFVATNPLTNFTYVTNTASNTISLINGKNDESIVRIGFKTQPENSGFIECNGVKNLNQNSTIISTNSEATCNAIPERGYLFDSWSGLVYSTSNPLKFNASEYGNIIANFRPTLSTEQYIFLIGGITGMSSVLLTWFFKGGQRRKFNKFIQITNKAIEDADVGDKKESIIKLENLRRDIFNTYRRGSLTDFQFDFLDKRLINYINKISNL